ncbi:CaiB/BaiF CoA transferase family protein [Saccharopolyspora rectivirgula]|jgi:itaconate CoA-transferase|uniref:Carnitine dehydratase n=1 Tax=Saccharopolyspora rectivirgula TaxID=28042 RepID=A0A073B292_9PSEU|nr:CaiB/BaiF CoA-transferase family protein [Saccharopolyspora rectivirgula]KEI45720.1 carnitine dehydratase [Saccharopolyspora rectivirgula]
MLPLEGVTVVSLEQAVAAPFATRQLADLGARVIKVERPGGDFARAYDTAVNGMSSHFVWLNRNKESLVVDLKTTDGQRVVRKLLDRADVFVQNLAPGAAARLGLGAAELRERNPRLVVCDISGYGSSGPYRDKKAYDLLIQCETGLVSITGNEAEPAKTGISVADIAGGMYAFSGVLTALYERERTGEGTAFEVSLFDALAEWMGYPYYYAVYGGTAPKRTGARHAAIAPYGPFTAGDGSRVFLGVQNEREWRAFCSQVLEMPELAADPRFSTNPRRVANNAELVAIVEAAFRELSSTEVLERLQEAGIANARMRTVAEFAEHPQLRARERWREVDSPAGRLRALLPPVTYPDRELRMDPIPEVGEHTDKILAELDEPAPQED